MLRDFECFSRLLIIFNIDFFKKKSSEMPPNGLDPDQARHFVGPDLGPNRLQNDQQTTAAGAELINVRNYVF